MNFKLPGILVWEKNVQKYLFHYINSELIRNHDIKRMGVSRKMTHPKRQTVLVIFANKFSFLRYFSKISRKV